MFALKSLAIAFGVSICVPGLAAHAQDSLPIPSPLEDAPGLEPPQIDGNLEGVPGVEAPTLQAPVPAAAASQPTAASSKLFSGGGVAVLGGVGASSGIAIGFNAGAALFSVGLDFRYDSRGLANGTERASDRLGMRLSLSFAFMAYNKTKVAFGPEFGLLSSLAPGDAFTSHSEIRPGLALWYAPFDAPLLVGTALLLPITFQAGADPVIGTEYPGLRLRYGF